MAQEDKEDVAAIRKLDERFLQAVKAGDLDEIDAVAADDIVQMLPNCPAVIGHQANRAWFKTWFDRFRAEEVWSSDEIVIAGDWAFHRGAYALTMAPKAGGDAIQDKGKYIWIYNRQSNGSWKFARVIFNSDLPLPNSV